MWEGKRVGAGRGAGRESRKSNRTPLRRPGPGLTAAWGLCFLAMTQPPTPRAGGEAAGRAIRRPREEAGGAGGAGSGRGSLAEGAHGRRRRSRIGGAAAAAAADDVAAGCGALLAAAGSRPRLRGKEKLGGAPP